MAAATGYVRQSISPGTIAYHGSSGGDGTTALTPSVQQNMELPRGTGLCAEKRRVRENIDPTRGSEFFIEAS
jgi:hypothetical protein